MIIDQDDDYLQAHQVDSFEEEELAYHASVSKHDDAFYMYLFADEKNEVILKAKERFEEMNCNGEWMLMKDETD